MEYFGRLNLNNHCDYTIFDKGNFYNISGTLNSMLFDNIELTIKNRQGDILFHEQGKLIKDKFDKTLYKYTVDKKCFDDILWVLANKNDFVYIEFKNIKKEGRKRSGKTS